MENKRALGRTETLEIYGLFFWLLLYCGLWILQSIHFLSHFLMDVKSFVRVVKLLHKSLIIYCAGVEEGEGGEREGGEKREGGRGRGREGRRGRERREESERRREKREGGSE